jgi:Na+/melibiose symporter-like transporter
MIGVIVDYFPPKMQNLSFLKQTKIVFKNKELLMTWIMQLVTWKDKKIIFIFVLYGYSVWK